MNILVLNSGSSSLKAALIDTVSGNTRLELSLERMLDQPIIKCKGTSFNLVLEGRKKLLEKALDHLKGQCSDHEIHGLGHRVVHGGEAFSQPILIEDEVEKTISDLAKLAPLHNPLNLLGIQVAKAAFPSMPHIAVFDTAFHCTLPKRARTYALPKELAERHGIRRYGFHGTSHAYVAELAAQHLGQDLRQLNIITCHLGNGCSMAAIEYGRSVETSMGMTPLEGLVMGTRSGDIDPGILIYLKDRADLTLSGLDDLLNKQSGLKGLSGISNDMRDIIEKASEGDEDCRLAMQVFAHRVRKYIGAYAATMGGVDAIVFTGGIGENSAVIRHRIAQRLDFMGALINEDKNTDVELSHENPVADFAMNHSRVRLLAVKTNEQLSIAQQSAKLIAEENKVNTLPPIPVAISARHMHITQETLEELFGKGYQLTEKKPLSQPGQFAANETVNIVGPKNTIERVRILGPVRSKNQIEISRTDEFFLGIDAPIRESGKVVNSPGCVVVGPKGKVTLNEGVICAWRHIHMTPEDAALFQVKDRDIVEIKIENGERSLTFGNVLIRVSPKYKLEMHIDTDEGNAAEIGRNAMGALVLTSKEAHLKSRRI